MPPPPRPLRSDEAASSTTPLGGSDPGLVRSGRPPEGCESAVCFPPGRRPQTNAQRTSRRVARLAICETVTAAAETWVVALAVVVDALRWSSMRAPVGSDCPTVAARRLGRGQFRRQRRRSRRRLFAQPGPRRSSASRRGTDLQVDPVLGFDDLRSPRLTREERPLLKRAAQPFTA